MQAYELFQRIHIFFIFLCKHKGIKPLAIRLVIKIVTIILFCCWYLNQLLAIINLVYLDLNTSKKLIIKSFIYFLSLSSFLITK